ncbi:MAG: hypothetical protein ACYDIA_13775 [Candidatus Humimicrobiaceae bacterium]
MKKLMREFLTADAKRTKTERDKVKKENDRMAELFKKQTKKEKRC